MVITDVSERGIRETVSMVEQATAAEMMSVSIEAVTVRLGDSDFPVSAGSGGQVGANNSTAGVYAACVKLREAVTQHLVFNSARAEFADGQVRSGNRSVPLGQAAGRDGLMAENSIEYGDLAKRYQQSTFAGHFVEMCANSYTGETRVRRMLAVGKSRSRLGRRRGGQTNGTKARHFSNSELGDKSVKHRVTELAGILTCTG